MDIDNHTETKDILEKSNVRKPSITPRKSSIFSSRFDISHQNHFVNEPFLSSLDVLISIFIVTPLVVATWRGSWKYMDVLSSYFPPWQTFTLGAGTHIFLAVIQDYLHDVIIVQKEKQLCMKVLTYVSMKIYTYVFVISTTLHWRGVWLIVDEYTGVQYDELGRKAIKEGSFYIILISATCFCVLCLMRCLRNATAPPFAICLDIGTSMFLFPSMFKTQVKKNPLLRILDCSFSVLIVGNMVVIFWRGFWVVCDTTLYPQNIVLSSWTSLIVGYLIVAIVFRLQEFMKKVCASQEGLAKIILVDSYIILSIIGTLNIWRGIWNLLDTYLIIGPFELCFLGSHYFSFICLVLLNCSNSCLVRGVYKDAEEPGGESVVFPCQFLRIILKEEKSITSKKIPRSETEDGSNVKMLNSI